MAFIEWWARHEQTNYPYDDWPRTFRVHENISILREAGSKERAHAHQPIHHFNESQRRIGDLMSNHEYTTFGITVRQLRKSRNLSQEAFAEICGLHRTYICDVERGTRNVTVGTLLKMALALGTTVSELTRNLENDVRSPGACPTQQRTSSNRLVIGVLLLFLTAVSVPAQSILEDLSVIAADETAILQDQVESDVSRGNTQGANSSVGNTNAIPLQTLAVPAPVQASKVKSASTVINTTAIAKRPNGVSSLGTIAIRKPASRSPFGVAISPGSSNEKDIIRENDIALAVALLRMH